MPSHTSLILVFILYIMHVASHNLEYSNFYDMHESLSRIRRASGTAIQTSFNGNETSCTDDSPNINCTITETHVDHHDHYRSTYYPKGASFFVDISSYAKEHNLTIIKHEKLSSSYNKAYRIPVGFHFPFYGNYVDRIVVTTAGFINIGPKFHAFVNQVHYIAPLMADFNPSSSNSSSIYIAKSNGIMVIQWNNLSLNGHDEDKVGFTFQVVLYKNGTVIMAYKNIPIPPTEIKNVRRSLHTTVGFADGFILTYKKHDSFRIIIHNLIYSYHKVNFPLANIRDGVAYKLDLLPNCIQFNDCLSCLNESKYTTNFSCKWCPALKQCSDAFDWNRQRWLTFCVRNAYADVEKCSKSDEKGDHDKLKKMAKKELGSNRNVTAGIVLGLLLLLAALIGGGLFIYAYTHPLSRLGLCLIENRHPTKRFQKLNNEDEYI